MDVEVCIYTEKNKEDKIKEVDKHLDSSDLIVIFIGNPYKPEFIFSLSEWATIEDVNEFNYIEEKY